MPGDNDIKDGAVEHASPPVDNLQPQEQLPRFDLRGDNSMLEQKGMLPVLELEDGKATIPGKNQPVEYAGEKWLLRGTYNDKLILFQQGRGDGYAGDFRILTGLPDAEKYHELKLTGTDTRSDRRYYADGRGEVYQVFESGQNKYLMASAHDVVLADRSQVQANLSERPPQPQVESARERGEAKEFVRTSPYGREVDYRGEKLKLAGYAGEHVLLYEEGRRGNYAVVMQPVTEAKLKSDYQEVKVNIGGREESRFIEKGHPENGVFRLSEFGSSKQLYQDHQFEVVKKRDLPRDSQTGQAQQTERPPQQRLEAAKEQGEAKESTGTSPYGREVDYRGEKLKLVGYAGEHVLLFEQGRRRDYAVVMQPVTDAELKSNYQEVKVNFGDRQESRFIEKGHPENGVFRLSEFASSKQLYQDHQFEVVKKRDLPRDSKSEQAEETPERRVEPKESGRGEKASVADTGAERAAKIQPAGEHQLYGRLEERSREVNGVEVKVRTPTEIGTDVYREVEIDGRKIELTRRPGTGQQWFYSRQEGLARAEEQQVKLHVTGINSEDVAKLQKELLPALEDMRARGEVLLYKTFDPNFMDANWMNNEKRVGNAPGPTHQNSKAFTIYLPADKAELVARALDQTLARSGLVLDKDVKAGTVGDASRVNTQSRRVSLERDHWPATISVEGFGGALLDKDLADHLTERYKSLGVDEKGRLALETLRRIEQDAGLKEGQLKYDREGRLMFSSLDRSAANSKGLYYADESKADKRPGSLTGRPALYALYEQAQLDPARVHLAQRGVSTEAARPQTAPDRELPSANKLRGVETAPGADGTLNRREVRPGEVLAREQIDRRERIDVKEIEAMKKHAAELERSGNETDRQRAEQLRHSVDALEGRHGEAVQLEANRKILEESRRLLDKGEGGGYGKMVGGTIGIAILASAGLAWYHSSQKSETRPLERAKVTK